MKNALRKEKAVERRIQKRPSPFPYLLLSCLFFSYLVFFYLIFSIYLRTKKNSFFRLQKAGLFCYTGSVPLLGSGAEKKEDITCSFPSYPFPS